MKLLQINTVCGTGSTGRIATDIEAILKEKGHESYIAYGRGLPTNSDTPIRIGNKIDNYTHVAKTRLLDMHGFGSKKSTQKFIAKVKELNPDVIHLHNIHGYFINIEILFDYLKEANKPVVWTLHDCWPFTGHCAYFDFVGCECWKVEGSHRCSQKNSYPASLLINNSRNNYERKRKAFTGVENLTIVTPSKWLANLVKKSFLRDYPVKVINNGVNLEVFKPTENNFREKKNIKNKFIILGVASIWEERKGFEYFKLISQRLCKDEIIVIVGLTEKQRNNLPSNIIGITRTNNIEELVEIYSSADVFVNPTLEDNFPTTNIESLACGTPIVTFNTGGSVECVYSDCGFVVEKGNIEELIDKIKIVKEKRKSSYSEQCKKRSRALYDKNDRYFDYLKTYEGIL
ncbi:glycosyltransferase [Virgibacillus litoralis]|uniref:Glycosyltransferase involved in cell wall biosynthesis n=1 Tax=Virgibacillus litoralis TaxID=578221 RepID=A0ABS4HIX3_9BACI|nr:glycosyltransferase involved in cell wall biosynthesis [Virgibacillus litoralis]